MLGQFVEQLAQHRRDIDAGKKRRHRAHRDVVGPDGDCIEADVLEKFRVFSHQGHIALAQRYGNRRKQGLGNQRRGIAGRFHFFVQDALVCGVHIDNYQSGRVLRKDIHAVDLRQRVAQGKFGARRIIYRRGRNGVMATIVRDHDLPYRWHVGEIALEGIAARERTLPRNFIADDGFHISDACRRYLLPLIQGEAPAPFRHGLPVHARLAAVRVPKRLPPWTPA